MTLRFRSGPTRVVLLAGALLCWAWSSFAQGGTPSTPAEPIPGTLGLSPFSGSTPAKLVPGVFPLSLQDAINRGLRQNLGALLSSADIRSAQGQRWEQLSALLPHVTAAPNVDVSQINLAELGFTFSSPGFSLPPSIGPFSYFDARMNFSQSLFDWKLINNGRASRQSLKSAEYTYQDARDLVVLAVGYTYLPPIADEARIPTAEAQVKTAQALYDQASDQVAAGTSAAIDALRAKVEQQTRQQQLIQARNNYAIQKLTVARVIGLAPGQEFELTDKSPYQPFEGMSVDDALTRAYASRSDYQAAIRNTHAAEFTRKAAAAGYFPSLSFQRRLWDGWRTSFQRHAGLRRKRLVEHSYLPGRQRSRRYPAGGGQVGTSPRTYGATGPLFSLLPPENATGNYLKIVQRIPVKIVLGPGENRERLLRPGMNVVPDVCLK